MISLHGEDAEPPDTLADYRAKYRPYRRLRRYNSRRYRFAISLAIKEDIMVRISVLAAVLFMTGCVSMSSLANSPVVINQLKIRSAGYTGCTTEENEISNVNPRPDGSGTWNATCKGKVYLCSQGSSEGHASTYSCAAAVN